MLGGNRFSLFIFLSCIIYAKLSGKKVFKASRQTAAAAAGCRVYDARRPEIVFLASADAAHKKNNNEERIGVLMGVCVREKTPMERGRISFMA